MDLPNFDDLVNSQGIEVERIEQEQRVAEAAARELARQQQAEWLRREETEQSVLTTVNDEIAFTLRALRRARIPTDSIVHKAIPSGGMNPGQGAYYKKIKCWEMISIPYTYQAYDQDDSTHFSASGVDTLHLAKRGLIYANGYEFKLNVNNMQFPNSRRIPSTFQIDLIREGLARLVYKARRA